MTEHTPGPWIMGKHYETTHGTKAHYAISQSGEMYDHALVFSAKDKGEGRANAHLITAAPELLEACKEAIKALIKHTELPGETSIVKQKLCDVIRKAEA